MSGADDTFRSTASPDSQDGSVSSMYSGMSSAVPSGAPAHVPEHAPPPPTTPSVTWPSERPHRRSGKSRRTEPPKDPRATNRLLDQRKSDDENIEALCKLFVPEGAEVKWKKDRLGMILHYATQLVERYNQLLEYYERNNSVRKGQLAQSDQGLTENQGQLLSRHGDYSRMMGHWVATTNDLDSALGNVEPGLRHQQRNSQIDEKHDATRQQ